MTELFFQKVVSGLAKHNSPETTKLDKSMSSQSLCGVQEIGWGSREAASPAVLRQAPSLISGVTEAQPTQSHCTAEAVTGSTEVSAVGKTQVVLAQSAPPVTGGAEGGLSGVCERWHWVLRMARTFWAAPAENYDAWI